MKNRLTFLFILVSLLGGFFFYRYVLMVEKPFPKIEDRLPDEPFIGKIKIVDLADELKPLLFKNKVSYRDFIASDFILTQTKNAGINLQSPVYFYVSDEQEFGALISLSDSSKVPKAITRLKSIFDMQDTIINSNVIYKINEFNVYLAYERNWMFVYKGSNFVKNYFQVKFADHTSMKKCWKDFLGDTRFADESFVVYARPLHLQKKQLKFASFAVHSDSSTVYLKSIVADKKKFPIQVKDTGSCLTYDKNKVKNYVDLHVDVTELKQLKNHFIYSFLSPYTKKVNFPLVDFIKAWDGDLSLSVGGKMKVKETYIETQFDEDFNAIDVTKTQLVEKDMFSGIMTTTSNFQPFINKLFAKGYLRKEEDKYYFLMSPPVRIITFPDIFYVFTGMQPKVTRKPARNEGKVRYDGADFMFSIDSITHKEMFVGISLPFEYLIRKYNIKTSK